MCEARWESVWAWVAVLLLCVPAVRSDAQACPALDAEVEAVVIENNVTEHVLGQVKVVDKVVPFDELMAAA